MYARVHVFAMDYTFHHMMYETKRLGRTVPYTVGTQSGSVVVWQTHGMRNTKKEVDFGGSAGKLCDE